MTEGTSSSSGFPEQTPSSQLRRSPQVNVPSPVISLLCFAWPLFPGPCLSLLCYGSVTLCPDRFSVPLKVLTFPSSEGILQAIFFLRPCSLCMWSYTGLRAKHSLKLHWKRAVSACAEEALFWRSRDGCATSGNMDMTVVTTSRVNHSTNSSVWLSWSGIVGNCISVSLSIKYIYKMTIKNISLNWQCGP